MSNRIPLITATVVIKNVFMSQQMFEQLHKLMQAGPNQRIQLNMAELVPYMVQREVVHDLVPADEEVLPSVHQRPTRQVTLTFLNTKPLADDLVLQKNDVPEITH